MIFSSINCSSADKGCPEVIKKVLEYLRSQNFEEMEAGVYEIQGKEIYAQVFDAVTEPAGDKRPEVHEKYLDVQFLVSGRERIGITPDTGSYKVAERIEERDLIFYESVENESFLEMRPGYFCVFFPSDVHRPAVVSGDAMSIRKVVVKVSVSLL